MLSAIIVIISQDTSAMRKDEILKRSVIAISLQKFFWVEYMLHWIQTENWNLEFHLSHYLLSLQKWRRRNKNLTVDQNSKLFKNIWRDQNSKAEDFIKLLWAIIGLRSNFRILLLCNILKWYIILVTSIENIIFVMFNLLL